jgi:intracellular septation protein
VFVFFGSMTLYFHNPIFIKWKPTVVFWIFSLVILGSQFFTSKPLMQRLMANMLEEKCIIPPPVWKRLNLMWALFFLVLGSVNLYVAYSFSNEAWVNFKFYGVTSALFLLSIVQALYLIRYMPRTHNE